MENKNFESQAATAETKIQTGSSRMTVHHDTLG
jgi:hypothetical protein